MGITNMVMPKIEREAEARNYGKFVISPLERGYGVTLGNALRRVLLSSLEGAAVTSIRIADVLHEFSEIPGVREDVIQVTLQVKQLRLKLDGVDTTRMNLEVRGEGTVTAADIITPADLEIWTDGTISPERSLSTAAKLVIDHLRYIAGVSEETLAITMEKEVGSSRLTSELADTPVEALDLSVRVFNSLKRTGITTVGDVLDLLEKGETAVMSIRNFGEKSLDELRQKMREKGYMKDETSSVE